MAKSDKSGTNIRMDLTVAAKTFSWQLTYFEMLHDALVEAFNETITKAKESDAEWKDNDSIQYHVEQSGLLDETLKQLKLKFLEYNY